jgi:hypothetical protein
MRRAEEGYEREDGEEERYEGRPGRDESAKECEP